MRRKNTRLVVVVNLYFEAFYFEALGNNLGRDMKIRDQVLNASETIRNGEY